MHLFLIDDMPVSLPSPMPLGRAITLQQTIKRMNSKKQSVTFSRWVLVLFSFLKSSSFAAGIIIVPVSGFVSWDAGGLWTKHLFTLFVSRRSKTAEPANKLSTKCFPRHHVASPAIYIASWARPSCRHVVFPRRALPLDSQSRHSQGLHCLDMSNSEEFQSQHGITFAL